MPILSLTNIQLEDVENKNNKKSYSVCVGEAGMVLYYILLVTDSRLCVTLQVKDRTKRNETEVRNYLKTVYKEGKNNSSKLVFSAV